LETLVCTAITRGKQEGTSHSSNWTDKKGQATGSPISLHLSVSMVVNAKVSADPQIFLLKYKF
jgi:hypothetical protein